MQLNLEISDLVLTRLREALRGQARQGTGCRMLNNRKLGVGLKVDDNSEYNNRLKEGLKELRTAQTKVFQGALSTNKVEETDNNMRGKPKVV